MSLPDRLIMKYFAVILLFTGILYPQTFRRELNSIPFSDQQGPLTNIFSGGTNNPEPQFIDIDNDGDPDIFFIDSDGTYGWYKNDGSPSDPHFVLSFDTIPGLYFYDWFFFADIDNDNDFDLFTGTPGAYIQFRINIGTPSIPSFTLEEDTLKDNNGDPIYSEFGCNPVFADVDDDGDKDFVSGNSVGTLNYYENIGTPSSFNLKFITNIWQGIYIISGGKREGSRHGASSLDFADIDSDGDLDLFWGDFFSRSLYFIENQGTPSVPDLNVVYNRYPHNQDSVFTSGFNMPRFTDIDNDGDLDLFVTVLYDPTVPQSLMYYRNDGNANVDNFQKVTENYLKTLDGGNDSSPFFADLDNDGDPDLLMGSTQNPDGTLFYFENTGTITQPSFLLIDSVYFGIKNELFICPAVSDIDGDGDPDLLIGCFDGTISLYINIGTSSSPDFKLTGKLGDNSGALIDVGVYARPFLFDYDNDGDPDLAAGAFNGKFYFYKNTGTPQTFQFTADTTFIHRLNPQDPDSPVIDVGDNSSPFFIDYDNDGDVDFFAGNRDGFIFYYRNDGNNVHPLWTSVTNNFIGQDLGADIFPCFADIDNDTDQDFFVGNLKGGLYLYRNQTVTGLTDTKNKIRDYLLVSAYPNPFNPSTRIDFEVGKQGRYSIIIYDILGREVNSVFYGELPKGLHQFNWNGKNKNGTPAASGIYLLSARGNDRIKTIKLLLLK